MKLQSRVSRGARRALLGITVLVVPLVAHAAFVRSGSAIVQFAATGPAGLQIVGKTSDLTVVDAGDTIKITVPLAGLRTGIDSRDNHLHQKALHTAQYPYAELDVKRAAIKFPSAGGTVTDETTGVLHLHGKANTIKFKYTLRDEGGRIKVEGGFRIDIRNFGMEIPHYMGLKVKPEVDAGAHFYVTGSK